MSKPEYPLYPINRRLQSMVMVTISYALILFLLTLGYCHHAERQDRTIALQERHDEAIRLKLDAQEQRDAQISARYDAYIWRDAMLLDSIAAFDYKLETILKKRHETNATIDRFTDVERQRYFSEHYPDTAGEAALRRAGYLDAGAGR
jgi:hypothetical protein